MSPALCNTRRSSFKSGDLGDKHVAMNSTLYSTIASQLCSGPTRCDPRNDPRVDHGGEIWGWSYSCRMCCCKLIYKSAQFTLTKTDMEIKRIRNG